MQSQILMIFFDWPTWLIVAGLLAAMVFANEFGFRFGRRLHGSETETSRSVTNSLKGSIFGLVALLLAFSFSATTARYDLRQRLVLDQANAVGTCYLRAGLLDDENRGQIQGILRQYVDVRIRHHSNGHIEQQHSATRVEIDQRLAELWSAVEDANRQSPDGVRNSLIVPAANEVIDLSSMRVWANRNHLPDPVLILLLSGVVISSLLLGHSSGQSGQRHPGLWLATNVVFALVMFVVLDFDRPRRGLIRLDLAPLIELQASFDSPASQ